MALLSFSPPSPPSTLTAATATALTTPKRIPLSPKNSTLPSALKLNAPTTKAEVESIRFDSQEEKSHGEDSSMVVVDSDEDSVLANEGREEESIESSLVPLHVEVRLLRNSTMRFDLIRGMIYSHLHGEYDTVLTHSEVSDWKEHSTLAQHVDRVWIGECSLPSTAVPLCQVSLQIHVYQPSDSPFPFPMSSNPNGNTQNSNDEDGDGDVPAASVLELPSSSLEGVWDSLIYEGDVKGKLLGYIYSTMLFSDAMVDFNIVTWNRVVLLHGPPGTGKTSLCKALAQKLAIRLSNRYEHGKLIEINSHSLFSKWFSESGKLVQKLFAAVTEMVDDESGFVVVLIDEVESLTAARAGAMSGKEPSDALRVVNALLTQLDKLKHRKNCLVMTTSNLSGAIDGAFIDRADIKQYIGLPPAQAVYWILQSCLNEIIRAGLIAPTKLLDWNTIEAFRSTGSEPDRDQKCSLLLYDLSFTCQGMSGRTLRRLPVLAHARYIGMTLTSPPIEVWLEAMSKAVKEEGEQMELVDRPAEV